MNACVACGAQVAADDRFCARCGAPQAQQCPTCGRENPANNRFCPGCGTALATDSSSPAVATSAQASVSERRLVSVLFADLVGFTTLSEHRDPEEVRELLSRYFDRCRSLIERYGGTVEKFIGDAVMAVWGTPVAREDDAERAVRAALSLTGAVTLLGEEVGMPELRVRAGVLTGNAAVEVGAEGEGMVLGDTVNTASRLQSIASPGTVLVDDVTRRSTEAAIEYEDAGEHQVKGRDQPVRAWTALRVVAGVGGARRSVGLEAPFVGRQRELDTIVESFESSAAESRAGLVTVTGDAGVGKSRLLWEFFKYTDGVEKLIRWHQGRCLAYGEGVAYWALAEMVRSRAGILEEEGPATAREKLRATIEEFVHDERELRLVEPRLAHLLGLEQRTAPDRADLFSGWRLFFERISEDEPVVLVFEDLQWADSGLLDFIDYLLEWSGEHRIFILALGRSELTEARPQWTPTISLEPLGDDAMMALLEGLVPGLPVPVVQQIRRRAEGVPLYAVETVRMLLDRGLLAQDGTRYVVTGDVSDLDVPETLQALVAARLDNLSATERTLLQDAAVIGQSFTPATLLAVSGYPEAEVKRVLDTLVAKQVLTYTDDPRSAEHGQYSFLQALLRSVAVGTLSRRDRKAKHLAVARHLEELWGEEVGDIAEVLASHYLEAVEAEPEAADAEEIRASACRTLEEAGNRAISLALGPEARRYFERAAELTPEAASKGRLLGDAGSAALATGDLDDARALLEAAARVLEDAGLTGELALVESFIGFVLLEAGRTDEADEILQRAHAVAQQGGDDEAVAEVAVRRSRIAYQRGDPELALSIAESVLPIAEARRLGRVFVEALITKANVLAESGRPSESTALLRHAVEVAVEQDLGREAVRGFFNLAESIMTEARFSDAEQVLERGLKLVRVRGDRQGERWLLAQGAFAQIALGRWDEAAAVIEQLKPGRDIWAQQAAVALPYVVAARGDREQIAELMNTLKWETGRRESDLMAKAGRAILLTALGKPEAALDDALEAAVGSLDVSLSHTPFEFAEAVDCAFAADRIDVVEDLLERVDALQPVLLIPLLDAEASRARGRLAAHRDDLDTARQWFRRAIDQFRELGTPFLLARAQLQYVEMLQSTGADEDDWRQPRDEAADVFEALGALPWLERAHALKTAVAA